MRNINKEGESSRPGTFIQDHHLQPHRPSLLKPRALTLDQNLKHRETIKGGNNSAQKRSEKDDVREVDSYGEEEVTHPVEEEDPGSSGGREPTKKEISQFEDEDWHDETDGVKGPTK
jgi:hypothetical protein